MRIVLLANNWVGLEIVKYLQSNHEQIIALGIHEPEKQKYTKEIIKASKLSKKYIFTANNLREPDFITKIVSWKPDLIIAAFWGYILKPELIGIPPRGCINFHPGYLPYNRGVNPNVWPFIDGTPTGVTIHYIDAGVDTGDIIAREKVPIHPSDTAESIYFKTMVAIVTVFQKCWPAIRAGTNKRIMQEKLSQKPTMHFARDISNLDRIPLHRKYTGRELINRLRARSYGDRYYAYYKDGTHKVFVRLDLSIKNEQSSSEGPYFANKKIYKQVHFPESERAFIKRTRNIFYDLKNGTIHRVPSRLLARMPHGQLLEMVVANKTIVADPEIVTLLSRWREKHSQWFPSQFPVSFDSTKEWIREQNLEKADRILFLLYIAGARKPFGHIGLNRRHSIDRSYEVDNIVRGKQSIGSRGGMALALKLLEQWSHQYLHVQMLTLRVFLDNRRAIALYKRSGFQIIDSIPLRKIRKGNTTFWKEDAQRKVASRYFLVMKKIL